MMIWIVIFTLSDLYTERSPTNSPVSVLTQKPFFFPHFIWILSEPPSLLYAYLFLASSSSLRLARKGERILRKKPRIYRYVLCLCSNVTDDDDDDNKQFSFSDIDPTYFGHL